MSEVRFDNCLIEIDNVVYYGLPTKLVDYVKKLYENNKSYQRHIESLGDKLAENTNYWVRTTDERNNLSEEVYRLNNIINELAFLFDDYNEFNEILEKYNYELKESDDFI